MQQKIRKNQNLLFTCPFCKKDITSSKKTEVLYKSNWVDGCSDCYILSIEENTHSTFQSRVILELL